MRGWLLQLSLVYSWIMCVSQLQNGCKGYQKCFSVTNNDERHQIKSNEVYKPAEMNNKESANEALGNGMHHVFSTRTPKNDLSAQREEKPANFIPFEAESSSQNSNTSHVSMKLDGSRLELKSAHSLTDTTLPVSDTIHSIVANTNYQYLLHTDLYNEKQRIHELEDPELKPLYIGGLLELSINSHISDGVLEAADLPNGDAILQAADLALKHINERNFIPGYKLYMFYNDTKVGSDLCIIRFYDHIVDIGLVLSN